MRIGFGILNAIKEVPCPDTPPCGWVHREIVADGARPLLYIGPLTIPLPRLMMSFVTRRLEEVS